LPQAFPGISILDRSSCAIQIAPARESAEPVLSGQPCGEEGAGGTARADTLDRAEFLFSQDWPAKADVQEEIFLAWPLF
jgi:hypothetical protein